MNGLDFALWFEPKTVINKAHYPMRPLQKSALNSQIVTHATIHINAWKISEENTLDFGILFEVPRNPFSLNLYVPEQWGAFKFESIAGRLFEKNILWSFFNDVAEKASLDCSDSLFVRLKKDNENFIILDLPIHDNVDSPYEAKKFGSGTIIKIPDLHERFNARIKDSDLVNFSRLGPPKKLYLRFRISGDFIKKSFSNKVVGSPFVENFISVITLFDFSLNRVRRLPEVFYSNGKIFDLFSEFERVDFFLMMDAKEELQVAQRAHDVVQILEKDKWKDYFEFGKGKANDQILLYHWKLLKKEPKKYPKEFSIFLKTRKSRHNGIALIIAFVLAVSASILASCIYPSGPVVGCNNPSAVSSQQNTVPPALSQTSPPGG